MHAWTLLLVSHVTAALVSVGLGVVQLSRRKGDARHRLLGRVWVVRATMIGSWLGSGIAMVFAVALPSRMIPTFAVDEPLGAATALATLAAATVVVVVAGDRLARRAEAGAPVVESA